MSIDPNPEALTTSGDGGWAWGATPSGAGRAVAAAARLAPRDRAALQAAVDGGAWVVGLWGATVLRFNLGPSMPYQWHLVVLVPLAWAVQLVVGLVSGLYRRRWRLGSFEEVSALALACVGATAVVFVVNWYQAGGPNGVRWEPASVPVLGGLIALVGMGAARYCWRLQIERRSRPDARGATRVLVFGAGEAGAQLIRSMLHDPESSYLPVGLLDDHPAKRNRTIMGVPPLGTRYDLAVAASRARASTVVVAIPGAEAPLVREVCDLAEGAGVAVKVMPRLRELVDGTAQLEDVRTPTVSDLLGRREIDTDLGSIAGYLEGRRVLVTGAGGSIGSELCRQIRQFGPAEMIMVDRDESALHALQLSLEGRALLQSPDLVLVDLRDRAAVDRLFAERRPQVVFHAAALKHLPVLELFPGEAVKTNVWGTLSVLEAASSAGVERFVNISTDKAAEPVSVLGYSKRVAERLTAMMDMEAPGTYLSVRFGNVLGSRGSMLTTFRAQIKAGGPVTVTDPEVTRYFMTTEEAVQLVIQAGAVGSGGEVLVLDMGTPVRVADVARRMIAEAGRPVEIVYTGLRAGEKLSEVLLDAGEEDRRPVHPLISHVAAPPLYLTRVYGVDPMASSSEVVARLHELSRQPGLRVDDLPEAPGA
ncbi:MAG: polysaccharide biosynthesis protein, partial [Acidimicrobiales bacterium]